MHLIHNELTTLNSELSDFEPVRSVNLNDFDFENLSLPRMQQLEKVVTLLMNEKVNYFDDIGFEFFFFFFLPNVICVVFFSTIIHVCFFFSIQF